MELEILSFFITNYGEPKPILFYPKGKPIHIDMHLMLNNFGLSKHTLKYKLTDGKDKFLGEFTQEVDLSKQATADSSYSVAEITIFAEFEDSDPKPEIFVKVEATIDDTSFTSTKFFIREVAENA